MVFLWLHWLYTIDQRRDNTFGTCLHLVILCRIVIYFRVFMRQLESAVLDTYQTDLLCPNRFGMLFGLFICLNWKSVFGLYFYNFVSTFTVCS